MEERLIEIFEKKNFKLLEKNSNKYFTFIYKNFKVYCLCNLTTGEILYRHKGKKYFDNLERLLIYYKKRYSLEIKSREKAIENYNLLLKAIEEL